MNLKFLSRVEKLEMAVNGAGPSIDWIIRRIIDTDSHGEATRAMYGETLFYRESGETERDFIERAQSEIMAASPIGTPRLIISELDLLI